ncbi:MAG: glycosyltransferase [Actinomycetes bacterium]
MALHHANSVDESKKLLVHAPSPVVVVPVYNAPEETALCIESILKHTQQTVSLLIIDDCGPDRSFFTDLEKQAAQFVHNIVVLRLEKNQGFIGACNAAFDATLDKDVILVNSDVIVGPTWYERMCAAANSATDIATVSVFTNNGTILSLPHRNMPWPNIPNGLDVVEASRRIASVSQLTRPTIPTAIGHCFLIKRRALNLVGGFDTTFGTGYGEEVDFSQRLIQIGLRHVVADDVFVFHKGSSSFTSNARPQQLANDEIVYQRYPTYRGGVSRFASDPYSPLAAAINRASFQLRQPTIAIDGHCFGQNWTGTQQMTFELIRSIAQQQPAQEFSVLISTTVSMGLQNELSALGNVHIEVITNIMDDRQYRFDVIIRPYQVNSTEELRWMKRIAGRCIVGQLDFISYHNPNYFVSDHAWLSQRELTRLTLASVDGVAWISEYSLEDGRRSGVVSDNAVHRVTYCGTNPTLRTSTSQRPATLHSTSPLITVLGVNYLHKNRIFALRVLEQLISQSFDCHLVLAGATPKFGSASTIEHDFLASHPELVDHVTILDALSEEEKHWLVSHSSLILYPSLAEGFGLVPFEAARLGTPTLSSRLTSLDEILPLDIPTVVDFDVVRTAEQIVRILSDSATANSIVEELIKRGNLFTWQRAGRELLTLIDEVLGRPKNRVDAIWAEAPVLAQIHTSEYLTRIEKLNRISRRLSQANNRKFVRALVGPAGSRRRQFLKKIPGLSSRG